MKDRIEIDGVTFERVDRRGLIKIVVLERGFVYVGRVSEQDDEITISGARSIIRWGTSQHFGELVNGPLANTKLGAPCDVRARWAQVIHTIEVNQDAWTE